MLSVGPGTVEVSVVISWVGETPIVEESLGVIMGEEMVNGIAEVASGEGEDERGVVVSVMEDKCSSEYNTNCNGMVFRQLVCMAECNECSLEC